MTGNQRIAQRYAAERKRVQVLNGTWKFCAMPHRTALWKGLVAK